MGITVHIDAEQIKRLVSKELLNRPDIVEGAARTLVQQRRELLARVAQSSYKGAVYAVGDVLADPGVIDLFGAGIRSRRVAIPGILNTTIVLQSGRAVAKGWPPLTPKYVYWHPRSTTVWKKTSELASDYARLENKYLAKLGLQVFMSSGTILLRRTGGLNYHAEFSIHMPGLDKRLDDMLLIPLAEGKIPVVVGDEDDETGVARARWAEGKRPWLGRLAHEIGELMRERMRSIR